MQAAIRHCCLSEVMKCAANELPVPLAMKHTVAPYVRLQPATIPVQVCSQAAEATRELFRNPEESSGLRSDLCQKLGAHWFMSVETDSALLRWPCLHQWCIPHARPGGDQKNLFQDCIPFLKEGPLKRQASFVRRICTSSALGSLAEVSKGQRASSCSSSHSGQPPWPSGGSCDEPRPGPLHRSLGQHRVAANPPGQPSR